MNKVCRALAVAALGFASLALASCGETPAVTAPQQTISQHNLLWPVTGLLACAPLPADSVTQVVGPDGGTINIGPHSFTVPAGALDSAVVITAVSPSGLVNRVVFQPAGLHFRHAAQLTMSYANILYFLPSLGRTQSQTVTASVRHFSDYAVAW